MSGMVTFDYSKATRFVPQSEVDLMEAQVLAANKTLKSRTGAGNDFLGWIDLPIKYDKKEFARIKKAAARIRKDSDVLIVIGIGGSYLGARCAIEFLQGAFYNAMPAAKRGVDGKKAPEIYFCGNSISASYLADLLDLVGDRDFSVNMISKSGTTTEPGIAFRIFKEKLVKKYGEKEAVKRIYATTDKARGALKNEANEKGYESFVVPDDVGGRYSVLTAVGLLPIAAAGIDIDALMKGAADMRKIVTTKSYKSNPSLLYAACRNILMRKGKAVEILVNYEPTMHNLSEWWKQLYGESEGKDNKGLMPASVDFTTDLHSMGQFIQDGSRVMFETVLKIEKSKRSLTIPKDDKNLDGLGYLAGKKVEYVNEQAMNGTILAHSDGNCPNFLVHIPDQSAYSLGQVFYFFEYACGVSGYLNGINPFDQPGVENYKTNMFALLKKPGYEKLTKELLTRL